MRTRYVALGLMVLAALFGVLPEAVYAIPFMIGNTETTANLDALMKITFDDTLIVETVTDTELLDLFPEGEVKHGPEGRHFETAQLYQAPGSIGARSEGDYVPTPSGAKAANAKINLKKVMGSLEETAEVLKKIRGDKAAFVDWAKEQFPQFREKLSDELDRQALGDGSGIRARVDGDPDGENSFAVKDTLGVAGFDQSLMQFQRGVNLKAGPNADGSNPRAGSMSLLDVNWDDGELIVDDSVTGLDDGDFIWEGDEASGSVGKEMMGLVGMVDDGGIVETLQALDRSEHHWFRSYVASDGAKELNEDLLIEVDKIARFRGGGEVDTIISSEDAFNVVWRDLRADRAINDPRAYTAGRKGIDVLFGGTRVVNIRTARKLPSKLIFGLQSDQFRRFVLHEWEWDDTTGSIWKQVVDSVGRKDAFYAYGSMHAELAIKSPQRCWRVDDWAEPSG